MGIDQSLNVVVISHHALIRAGVAKLIEDLGHHVDGAAAVGEVGTKYDLVIYDLSGRLEARLNELGAVLDSGCRVVVLESPSRPSHADHLRSMGVSAAIGADASAADLAQAVEQAAGDHGQDRAARHACYRAERMRQLSSTTGITAREADVLSLIALGLGNQEIADELYLSINSVKSFIRTLYKRIHVTRRSEAVVWAVTRGLGPGRNDRTSI